MMKIKSLFAGLLMICMVLSSNAFAGTGTVTYLQFNSGVNGTLLVSLSDGTACAAFGDHGDIGAALMTIQQNGSSVYMDCVGSVIRVIAI